MQWELIIALVIAIPIILFPAAFVWYLNAGGLYHAVKNAIERRTVAQQRSTRAQTGPQPAPAVPGQKEAFDHERAPLDWRHLSSLPW